MRPILKYIFLLLIPVLLFASEQAGLTGPISTEYKAEQYQADIDKAMKYLELDDCKNALPYFEKVADAMNANKIENRTTFMYTNYYAGYCAKKTLDYKKAEYYLMLALRESEILSPSKHMPVILTFLGDIFKSQGDLSKSLKYYLDALPFVDNSSLDYAVLKYNIAESYKLTGAPAQAIENCKDAISAAQLNGQKSLQIACAVKIGESYYDQSQYPLALKFLNDALTMAKNEKLPMDTAGTLVALSIVYESIGRTDIARNELEEALTIYVINRSTANVSTITERLIALAPDSDVVVRKSINTYTMLSDSLAKEKDYKAQYNIDMLTAYYYSLLNEKYNTVLYYQKALSTAILMGDTESVSTLVEKITAYYIEEADYGLALEYLFIAQEYQKSKNDSANLAKTYANIAEIYYQLEQKTEAIRYYKNAAAQAINPDTKARYNILAEKIAYELQKR